MDEFRKHDHEMLPLSITEKPGKETDNFNP